MSDWPTTPTPVDELPPIERNLRRKNYTDPPVYGDKTREELCNDDPDLLAELAFANWITGMTTSD